MEEVDKIIIQSLKEIGSNLEDEVVSVKQLTAEHVVEAAARCLNFIQPSLNIPTTLPPSMSARYKIGSLIAEACMDLGYAGEIGYQTFLYSSEADVRRVFMFLVEKLPKETDKTSAQQEEAAVTLRQKFSEALRLQLAVPWSPSHSTSVLSPHHSFVSVPLETGISLPGQQRDCTPQEWREFCVHQLPFLHEQVKEISQLIPSVISLHTRNCLKLTNSTSPTPPPPVVDTASLSAPHSWMQLASSLLYTKDTVKKKEKSPDNTTEQVSKEVISAEQKQLEEQEAIERLKEKMDQLHLDIKNITTKLSLASSERLKQESLYKDKKKETDVWQKSVGLLPDSANNARKLQEVIDEQARTLLRLGTQWEKHRAPLVQRYREARRSQSNKATESVRQMEAAKETREKLREMREELATKEALQARLEDEHSKLAKTVSRTAYTRRILEIINNIKKQTEEIDKIVEDTKQLQRDINIVSDRVDRSFVYADETIFRDCKEDNASRKIYKLLMQVHAECRQTVAMIEETGAIVREIRDVEEQIEVEKSKDMASKLERINADLRQMKQETTQLKAQLAQAGVSS